MWIPYAKIIRKYTATIFRLLLHFRESYVQKFFACECTCPAFDLTDRALMVCVVLAYSYVYDHVHISNAMLDLDDLGSTSLCSFLWDFIKQLTYAEQINRKQLQERIIQAFVQLWAQSSLASVHTCVTRRAIIYVCQDGQQFQQYLQI